jgi:microcystin degradation protein MlrC
VLYVDTPGLLRSDFEHMDYRRRSLNYWPRVQDPWDRPDISHGPPPKETP